MDYHSPSLDSITFLGLTFEELFFLNYDLLSLKESKEIFGLRGRVKFLPRGPISKSGLSTLLSLTSPIPQKASSFFQYSKYTICTRHCTMCLNRW